MSVKTENFIFELLDLEDNFHQSVLLNANYDQEINKYFKEYKELVELYKKNTGVLVYVVRKESDLIGLVTLSPIDEEKCVFSHFILKEFRNNHYSRNIKKEFTNYLLENKYDEIICYIDVNNKSSIKSMMNTNPSNIDQMENKDYYKVTYAKGGRK